VATEPETVDALITLANPQSDDVIYDLGCGDGRIVIAAAKRFGLRGVGIDINPDRIAEATENARKAGVSDLVTFRVGDLYETDLRNATIVALYLLRDVNIRLRPKLQRELKPGSRVVSHSFDMGDTWKPDKVVRFADDKLFLWTVR
jgi:ubiquinone/menaquinone biosynthesis C-methylase UbiE